jgi:photosystem II stability/assembly factor-like uncharacterized protein
MASYLTWVAKGPGTIRAGPTHRAPALAPIREAIYALPIDVQQQQQPAGMHGGFARRPDSYIIEEGSVLTSSRKLVLGLVVALVCILGMLSHAQNPPQSVLTADDFNQFSWRWVGPMAFSGRITGFAVPRGQSQIYYVLTASGGLWKTEDGGIHFEPIFEKYGTLSMGWMAVAPSKSDVLYLGTGEPMHARSSTHGNGMWKSTDAGKTWTHIGLEKSYFIPKVEVDSKNPDIVLVAAEGKLYDNEMDCERGLYRSIDGGKTWTNIFASVANDRGVGDFVIDPRNSNIIIAAAYKTYRRAWTYDDRDPGNGIYRTTNGGKSWTKLTAGLPAAATPLGRIGLAILEKNPKIVYARVDQGISLGYPQTDGVANFRVAPAGRGGGGGTGGFGAAAGTTLFQPDFTFAQFKTYTISPEIAQLAPKFTPVTGTDEAELVKKFTEMVQDKDFIAKSGVDVAKLDATARRIYAKDADLMRTIDETEALMKKPAPAPDSTEAKVRTQILNRHVLEILYAGALNNLAPTVRNGMVYRSDDQGKTWKAMTEYKMPAPGTGGRGADAGHPAETLDEAAAQSDSVQAPAAPPAGARDGTQPPAGQTGAAQPGRGQAAGGRAAQAGSAEVNQTEGGYYGRIIIDPNDDKVVYCGDTNATVSRDSGKTFENTRWDGNGKTHVDHRVVWVDPLNSKHILSGNDGGVSETWDDGAHWSQKNGISAQQFYDVAVDNELPYNVMGGTQDNGAWLGPTQNRNSYGLFSPDWTYLPTGDGFVVVRDWWNPEYVYYESQFGASSRQNLTTGQTQSLAVRLTPQQTAAGEPALRYQWNAPIVLSPHNPGIVYTASQYVYRSLSRGDTGTFVRISPDLTKADKAKIAASRKTNLQWATVYTFSESPKKPGLYWAGTDDGNVQMSPDGGNTWVNITDQFYDATGKPRPGVKGDLIPYDRWVKRVVASAFDENTAYVGFSGYRTHNEDKTWLFVTKDLGKTWTNISGGMNNPIFDLEEDPENANVLYLGTDYGIFVTIDQGKTWTPFSTSAPNVTIRDVAIQKRYREMAIGTYGRGIYVTDIGPIKEFTAAVFQEPAHLFDIKPTIRWSRFERRGDTLGEMVKADNPPVGADIYYYLKADAQSAKLTIKDLEGTTLQDATVGAKKGLQKYFWNLSRQGAGGGRAGAGGRGGAGAPGGAGEPGGAGAAGPPNPDQPPQAATQPAGGPGGRGGRGAQQVEPGVYKVTLTVDGKEVATKRMTVSPDPLFK